jgi:hypothetical protein
LCQRADVIDVNPTWGDARYTKRTGNYNMVDVVVLNNKISDFNWGRTLGIDDIDEFY